MSGLGNIYLSSDEGMGDHAREEIRLRENMLRPIYDRPAYQYTELEDKINGSCKEYKEKIKIERGY